MKLNLEGFLQINNMQTPRLSPSQLQNEKYNREIEKLNDTSKSIPKDKAEYLRELSGSMPEYSTEYSPSPLRPGAGSSQRIDLGSKPLDRWNKGLLPKENREMVRKENQIEFLNSMFLGIVFIIVIVSVGVIVVKMIKKYSLGKIISKIRL